MANAEKDAVIADMAEKFRTSTAAVITEYRGLTVAQLGELRGKLRGNATYSVVKNTLTARAAAEAGVDAFDGHLTGPTAIAYITGDPVEAAKGLRDFAKANPLLVIKGGVLDGKAMSAEEIKRRLPSMYHQFIELAEVETPLGRGVAGDEADAEALGDGGQLVGEQLLLRGPRGLHHDHVRRVRPAGAGCSR